MDYTQKYPDTDEYGNPTGQATPTPNTSTSVPTSVPTSVDPTAQATEQPYVQKYPTTDDKGNIIGDAPSSGKESADFLLKGIGVPVEGFKNSYTNYKSIPGMIAGIGTDIATSEMSPLASIPLSSLAAGGVDAATQYLSGNPNYSDSLKQSLMQAGGSTGGKILAGVSKPILNSMSGFLHEIPVVGKYSDALADALSSSKLSLAETKPLGNGIANITELAKGEAGDKAWEGFLKAHPNLDVSNQQSLERTGSAFTDKLKQIKDDLTQAQIKYSQSNLKNKPIQKTITAVNDKVNNLFDDYKISQYSSGEPLNGKRLLDLKSTSLTDLTKSIEDLIKQGNEGMDSGHFLPYSKLQNLKSQLLDIQNATSNLHPSPLTKALTGNGVAYTAPNLYGNALMRAMMGSNPSQDIKDTANNAKNNAISYGSQFIGGK